MKECQQLETFNTNFFLVVFTSCLTGRSYVSGINQKAKVNACQLLPDRTYRIFLCLVQLVTTTSMYYWYFVLDIYSYSLPLKIWLECMYVDMYYITETQAEFYRRKSWADIWKNETDRVRKKKRKKDKWTIVENKVKNEEGTVDDEDQEKNHGCQRTRVGWGWYWWKCTQNVVII